MADSGKSKAWTDEDTDAFFTFLGKYLYSFQWIEGKLEVILLLAWGHKPQSHRRLARMTNREKIDQVYETIMSSPDFKSVQNWTAWCDHFKDVVERLHELRNQRNEMMHSQYLFEFTEIGLPPLQSNRRRVGGEVNFNQMYLDQSTQEKIMRNLHVLVTDVNFVYAQLIQAHQSSADFGATADSEKWRPISDVLFDGEAAIEDQEPNGG